MGQNGFGQIYFENRSRHFCVGNHSVLFEVGNIQITNFIGFQVFDSAFDDCFSSNLKSVDHSFIWVFDALKSRIHFAPGLKSIVEQMIINTL